MTSWCPRSGTPHSAERGTSSLAVTGTSDLSPLGSRSCQDPAPQATTRRSPRPSSPPPVWAPGSCPRPRRRPRRCCRSSTSRPSSTSSRRPRPPGSHDVLMVTGRSKRALEDHFDRAHELEQALAAKGDLTRLAQVRASADLASVHYVRQGDPLGLGHAVLCAAHHVGDEPFAVLLGDDLIDPRDPLLPGMIDVRERARRLGGRAHGGPARADPPLRLRRGRAHRRRGRRARHRPGREAVGRRGAQQLRRHRPLRPRPVDLRRAAQHRPGQGRRDPAHRCLEGRGRRAEGDGWGRPRRRLPRPPLRHRRPARLPEGRRAPGVRT